MSLTNGNRRAAGATADSVGITSDASENTRTPDSTQAISASDSLAEPAAAAAAAAVDTKGLSGSTFGNDERHGGLAAAFQRHGSIDAAVEEVLAAFRARAEPARLERVARIHRVDTKVLTCENFGNDAALVGFIRVRKRKLKGGHPAWRSASARAGTLATTSMSFDLVRAVRVGGKPRHEFLLGLGSQKNNDTGRVAAKMLLLAIGRMKRHGLNEAQRQALLAELIRKGARRPTVADCEGWNMHESWTPYVVELAAWLKAADTPVQP